MDFVSILILYTLMWNVLLHLQLKVQIYLVNILFEDDSLNLKAKG